jgi:hypothetical protein
MPKKTYDLGHQLNRDRAMARPADSLIALGPRPKPAALHDGQQMVADLLNPSNHGGKRISKPEAGLLQRGVEWSSLPAHPATMKSGNGS